MFWDRKNRKIGAMSLTAVAMDDEGQSITIF
jgi:hypothetical protein